MADDDANLEPNLELPKLFGRKKSGRADAASNKAQSKREANPETEVASEPSAPVAPAQPAARTAPPTPATPTAAVQTPAPEAEVPPRRPTAPVSATPQAQSVAQMPDPATSVPNAAATSPTTEPTRTPAVSAPAVTETAATKTAPVAATPVAGGTKNKIKRGLPTVALPSFPRRKPRDTSPVTATPVAGGEKNKIKRGLPTVALPSFSRRKPRDSSPGAASGPRSSLPTIPLPPLSGRMAAALTGAVIGLGLVLSTVGVLRGCDAIRGTKSCGGAGGFALLVVLIVLAVYLGALLLRAFGIPDPGSTSFLAIGVVVVLSMVVFIDSLLDWWMFLLIPAMSAAAYALSHYITTAVVEPAMDQTRDQRVD